MGWGYSDFLDVIPIVGAVNRAVRGEWAEAGINLGSDLLIPFTGGASKAGVTAARVGGKAAVEVGEHLLAKGVTSAGEHAAIRGATSAAEHTAAATVVHGFENGAISAGGKTFTRGAAVAAEQAVRTAEVDAWRAGIHASARPVASVVEHGAAKAGARAAESTAVKGAEHVAVEAGTKKAAAAAAEKAAAKEAAAEAAKVAEKGAAKKITARGVAKTFAKATATNALIMGGLAGVSELIPDANEDQGPDDQTAGGTFDEKNARNTTGISNTQPTWETGLIDYLPYVVGGATIIAVDGGVGKKVAFGAGAGAATYFVTHHKFGGS